MNVLKNEDYLDKFELRMETDYLALNRGVRSYWLERYLQARNGLANATQALATWRRVACVYGALALVGWGLAVLAWAGLLPTNICA